VSYGCRIALCSRGGLAAWRGDKRQQSGATQYDIAVGAPFPYGRLAMRQAWHRNIVVGVLALSVFLVACDKGPSNRVRSTTPQPVPTATSDPVTLGTDAMAYHVGDKITVTIQNHSDQTIIFIDDRSECTVIQLLHQVGKTWEALYNCQDSTLGIPTIPYVMKPGQSMTTQLSAPETGWPSGLYLAELDYTIRQLADKHVRVTSEGFRIM
jgi:hypothetical protein